MYQIQYQQPVHVHFIGIGGISMSGLAAILIKEGFPVTGSDSRRSALTEWLEELGATVFYGQRAENISEETEVVVYTAAVHPDNPEYQEALRRRLPMLSRAQLLGELMENYSNSIAVAGTHGKTTTTSMLAHILMAAETDPTISVGGMLQSIGGNVRLGSSDTFLTEACEYTNSFLSLNPLVGIILNIDADHLDFFKDLDDIRHSFRLFAENILPEGQLILQAETPDIDGFTKGLSCTVTTFGVQTGDYHAEDISYDANGYPTFTLVCHGKATDRITLKVPGIHNVSNACAAAAASDFLNIPRASMLAGLESFTGTDRRFQKKGVVNGITIIDDYAHHPTEISATLRAAANYKARSVWCVFQPHTYTRTKSLMDEFAQALFLADHVVLADIYAARETDTLGISSDTLRRKLEELGADAVYLPSFEEIEQYLLSHCSSGDLVLTMGAGDIYQVGEHLLASGKDKNENNI